MSYYRTILLKINIKFNKKGDRISDFNFRGLKRHLSNHIHNNND